MHRRNLLQEIYYIITLYRLTFLSIYLSTQPPVALGWVQISLVCCKCS